MEFINRLRFKKNKNKYVLDNDIKNIIKPFYIISLIFCLCKFRINKNFITPVTTSAAVLTCAANLFYITIVYWAMHYSLALLQSVIFQVFFTCTFVLNVVNFLVVSSVNILWTKSNTELILKLQTINRLLYDKKDINKLRIIIWVSLGTLFCLYCGVSLSKLILDPNWPITRILIYFSTILLDIEMIYVNVVAYFLACKIKKWNEATASTLLNQSTVEPESAIVATIVCSTFHQIVDGFSQFGQIYKYQILFHVITIFTQSMISIAIIILRIKQAPETETEVQWHHRLSQLIGVIVGISKALLLQTVLCITCESISSSVQRARAIVVDLSQRGYVHTRRLAKNVLRTSAIDFRPISACGVFTVRAALPLHICALLATYTIVLLQFAFL